MKKLFAKLLLPLSLSLLMVGCSVQVTPVDETEEPINSISETPIMIDENLDESLPEQTIDASKKYFATIKTNMGDIKLELYADKAPLTVNNFVHLSNLDFYDDLIFHRIIENFMIQGGDPDGTGAGGPGYTVPAEIVEGAFHKKGAIATARQSDYVNPEKNSSGSQFYIVHGEVYTDEDLDNLEVQTGNKFSPAQREAYKSIGGTPMLDNEYTVFGEVIEGLDIVDKIATVKTLPGDKPVDDVVITDIVIEIK